MNRIYTLTIEVDESVSDAAAETPHILGSLALLFLRASEHVRLTEKRGDLVMLLFDDGECPHAPITTEGGE